MRKVWTAGDIVCVVVVTVVTTTVVVVVVVVVVSERYRILSLVTRNVTIRDLEGAVTTSITSVDTGDDELAKK